MERKKASQKLPLTMTVRLFFHHFNISRGLTSSNPCLCLFQMIASGVAPAKASSGSCRRSQMFKPP